MVGDIILIHRPLTSNFLRTFHMILSITNKIFYKFITSAQDKAGVSLVHIYCPLL